MCCIAPRLIERLADLDFEPRTVKSVEVWQDCVFMSIRGTRRAAEVTAREQRARGLRQAPRMVATERWRIAVVHGCLHGDVGYMHL